MCSLTRSQVIENGPAAHRWRSLRLVSEKVSLQVHPVLIMTMILKCSTKTKFKQVGCVTPWAKCFRSYSAIRWWATNGMSSTSKSYSLTNTHSSAQISTYGQWRLTKLYPNISHGKFTHSSRILRWNCRNSFVPILPEFCIKSCKKVIGSPQLNWTS